MAAKKPDPDERRSIGNQLLVITRDLKGARAAYRDACLLQARRPDDQEHKHAVAGLEQEIAEHERSIARLEAAQQASTDTDVQQAEAQRIKASRDAARAAAATTRQIRKTLGRLVDVFEITVGPALAELDSLSRERTAHAWAAASGALGHVAAARSVTSLDQLAGDGHIADALLTAIVRSGLGQVGPRLDPSLTVSAPIGLGTPDLALHAFDDQAKRLDAWLADCISRSQQPALAEEE